MSSGNRKKNRGAQPIGENMSTPTTASVRVVAAMTDAQFTMLRFLRAQGNSLTAGFIADRLGYRWGSAAYAKAGARAAGSFLHRLMRLGLVTRDEGPEGKYYLWSISRDGQLALDARIALSAGPT